MDFLNAAEPRGPGPSGNRGGEERRHGSRTQGEAVADLCVLLCSASIVLSSRAGPVMRSGNQRGVRSTLASVPSIPGAWREQATASRLCLSDHKEFILMCMRSCANRGFSLSQNSMRKSQHRYLMWNVMSEHTSSR